MNELILALDNIRSLHNVGSLIRTADGLGVSQIITIGITPHTKQSSEKRLPHVVNRVENQLSKTALGAEKTMVMKHFNDVDSAINFLRGEGFQIIALEQDDRSIHLGEIVSSENVALVVGNEKEGVSKKILSEADIICEIPMQGTKNSYNVSVAGAIALYVLSST